jgi:hypothetical protein
MTVTRNPLQGVLFRPLTMTKERESPSHYFYSLLFPLPRDL